MVTFTQAHRQKYTVTAKARTVDCLRGGQTLLRLVYDRSSWLVAYLGRQYCEYDVVSRLVKASSATFAPEFFFNILNYGLRWDSLCGLKKKK
jgi:hypothetical protein